MRNVKVVVDGLKVIVKNYPNEVEFSFSTEEELRVFLLDVVDAVAIRE